MARANRDVSHNSATFPTGCGATGARPGAEFRRWLYRVVVNLGLNARRRAPDLPLDAAAHVADPAPGADAQLETRERDRRLAAAIDVLPDRQRTAIVLIYQEGLSNA